METTAAVKEFLNNWYAYRRLQAKKVRIHESKPSPKNPPKMMAVMTEISAVVKTMDQQAHALSSELKIGKAKKKGKREPVLPLFQAINAYFAEIFQQHKMLDELHISDAETFQCDLKARFMTEYPLADLEKKLEADGEVTPKGYLFKRADFFVPNESVEVAS